MEIRAMACCGLRELHGLSWEHSADDAMHAFRRAVGPGGGSGTGFRYVVFTQAGTEHVYGDDFAALIRDHKMGDVVETTGTHRNPNTNHTLKVWVWTVNHAAVKRFGSPQKATPKPRRKVVSNG